MILHTLQRLAYNKRKVFKNLKQNVKYVFLVVFAPISAKILLTLALVTTAVISRSPSRASISVMFSLSIFSPIHWTSADYVATYKHVVFGKEKRSNYDANGFFVFSFPDFLCDF